MTKMSLVADYSDSSTSSASDSEDSDTNNDIIKTPMPEKSILPSATFLLAKKSGEVFQNRFEQEEQAKKASLEHHVKMVENDENLKTKNGKKICWNYRKGRCRFGSKCQYAHDSDLVIENETETIPTAQFDKSLNTVSAHQLESHTSSTIKCPKRKHPGLGDSIVPGKRVMKAYAEQQGKP